MALYRGSPIERKGTCLPVRLYCCVRDSNGDWWLRTPAERGRIEVEDAPFVAVELDWGGTRPTADAVIPNSEYRSGRYRRR